MKQPVGVDRTGQDEVVLRRLSKPDPPVIGLIADENDEFRALRASPIQSEFHERTAYSRSLPLRRHSQGTKQKRRKTHLPHEHMPETDCPDDPVAGFDRYERKPFHGGFAF